MIEIISYNLLNIIYSRASKSGNPERYVEEMRKKFDDEFGKKRIGGLISGAYEMNLKEAIAFMKYFDLNGIDELVNYKYNDK